MFMVQTGAVKKETSNLIYSQYPNGIHEFLVKQSHQAAVDELMSVFANRYASTPNNEVLRRLFVMQSGLRVPSIPYTIRQTRKLLVEYPKPPKSRNAIIYEDNLALTLLAPAIRFLPFAMPLAFFRPNERER